MEAVDKALELRPDYFEALTYKNLLLRQQARLEKNPAKQQELIRQADELQKKAMDVRNVQTKGAGRGGRAEEVAESHRPRARARAVFCGRFCPGRNRPLSFSGGW